LNGELKFVSWRPLHNEHGERASKPLWKLLLPLIVLGGVIAISQSGVRNVWGFEWLAVRAFEFVIGGVIGGIIGLFPAFAMTRMLERRKVQAGDMGPGRLQAGPWNALQAFSEHREELSDRNFLRVMATFSDAHPAIEVSHHNWGLKSRLELNSLLTRQFVEARGEHLGRLMTAERARRREATEPREKVI
jgi:hypothetical protein